jgi:hypothetical protein
VASGQNIQIFKENGYFKGIAPAHFCARFLANLTKIAQNRQNLTNS